MRLVIAFLFLSVLASTSLAVPAQERRAIIGIYDDLELTRTSGVMLGAFKEIYVGIRFQPQEEGFTGLEFSVSGLEPFAWSVEYFLDPSLVIGTIAAPADTNSGSGGVDIAWSECVLGNHVAVAKLTLSTPLPPQDHTLRVLQRFPPTNPHLPTPLFFICDAPCFLICDLPTDGGTYVLNPTIDVQPQSWGTIKRLYDR